MIGLGLLSSIIGGSVATGSEVQLLLEPDPAGAKKASKIRKGAPKPHKRAPTSSNSAVGMRRDGKPFTKQEQELIARFGLSNASKIDAVSAAVEYLVKQQAQPNYTLVGIENTFNRQGQKFSDCETNPNCPVCKVSLSAILVDGMYVHDKEMSAPPYDYTCWSMRIRYHVAPACAEEELSRNVEPIYKWRWTLGAAEAGYCKMPDISPQAVGKQHQAQRQHDQTRRVPSLPPLPPKKNTTILFLGLSFLSEPFMAMGCLFSDQVTGGFGSLINPRLLNINKKTPTNPNPTIKNPYPFPFQPCTLPIAEIRQNGGQCTGFERSNIIDFFPPHLHQGWKLPTQNFNSCTMDHAVMEFGELSVYAGGGPGDATSSNGGQVQSNVNAVDSEPSGFPQSRRRDGKLLRKGLMRSSGPRKLNSVNNDNLDSSSTSSGNEELESHRVLTNSDGSTTIICFVYTFVVEANVPADSPLPCNLKSWMDIDVVISLLPYADYVLYGDRKNYKELEIYNMKRKEEGQSIHEIHFLNVNNLYENIITRQLQTAYRNNNFEIFEKEDYLAKFKKCGRGKDSQADIHYRMPGLPDFAAQMWLSYVATGVDEECDREVFEVTESQPHKEGMRYWL
jgi:hypothetical protein